MKSHRVHAAFRGLVAPLATPLLADDYLKLLNPLWSARELRGRVVEVRPEAANSATLVIKPGWGYRFEHQAGQFIGIGLLIDGRWRWRSYSLTSPALVSSRSATVSITVKAMPEGRVSGHLVGGLAPGTVVRLAAPRGNFVMPDPPPPSMLFLTGGSGITPIMAMLRTMKRRKSLTDIVHVHSAPGKADVLFAAELEELARTCPGYRLTFRASRTEGRLDVRGIGELVPDWRDRQVWVCGPEGLIVDAERHWAAAGLDDNLHVERFAAIRGGTGRGGTITFARTGRSQVADAATTLLEAGEQAGVMLPSGCRMGICHTCVVGLVDGAVRDLRTGTRHEPGTRVQTCVSAADGNCVLDI